MIWTVRGIVRYGAVVLAGIIAGSRAVTAYQHLVQWRLWRDRDPSGAEASLTFAQLDIGVALLGLALAGAVWWLLRPRAG